jgi:tripartite-type tricarboxylate transporter receptor subunit TctC
MGANTQPLGPTPSIATELPGFEFASWIGLMAPKGIPPAASEALAKALAAAVQRPEVQKAFESNGAVAHPTTGDEFRVYLARDIEVTRRAIAAAGVQAE